jgi:CHAT domain-containing protein
MAQKHYVNRARILCIPGTFRALAVGVGVWMTCLAQTAAPAPGTNSALVQRLTNAQGEQALADVLNSAGGQIDEGLFAACRNAAQALLDHAQYPDAIRGFQAALAVANRLNSPADIAESYRGIGLGYRYMDQYTVALENYDKALAAAETSGRKPLIALILRARGVSLRIAGRTSEAIAADEGSLAIYRELDDKLNVARSLNNLGTNYLNLGNLRRAAEIFEESYRDSASFPELADFVAVNLSIIAVDRGNLAAARGYLEQAINGAERRHNSRDLYSALFDLAVVDARTGQLDRSLEEYGRTVELARDMHSPMLEAKVSINRSAVYARQKRPDLATADLRRGLTYLTQADDAKTTGLLLVPLAHLAVQRGDTAEAVPEAEHALELGRKIQSYELLWQALMVSGECALALKDREQARRYLDESIRDVELQRDLAGGDEQSMASFLNTDMIEPYHEMLGLLVETGDSEAALAMAERAKARQLLDTVRSGKTEPRTAMSPAERAEEQRLSHELVRMDRRLAAAEPARQAAARAEWQAAQVSLESFREHLYSAHPELAAQRGDAAPITLAESADLLPDKRTALVEFAVADDEVYVFAVTRGPDGRPAITVHREPLSREKLAGEVSAFRDLLAARSFQYRGPAAALYRKLLGPVAAQLQGRSTVVIVPDGPLWDLPFQALIGPDDAHLIERRTVFYSPSLTYLRDSRRLRSPDRAPRLVLALGNPGSAHLATSEQEVHGLAPIYGPDKVTTLTGGAATKQAWMEQAPQYRVLHVATHGILNTSSPIYSWLSLAPARPGGPDDALEAREVLGMNLRADVAVLSACETARGGVSAGEGLVGMSWAFLIAGASATVVSQWAVDSGSTTQLMLAFHKNLKPALDSGAGRARALRSAALAVMRVPEYRHPYYWAGFVEVGDGY